MISNISSGLRWRPRLTALLDRFEPSLRQRIVSGAVWSIAGAGLASGLTMVSNVVCARFLGATRFGELAIVLATTNFFTTLLASGLGMTATRFVAEHRNSDPQRAGTVVGLSWVTSIVVGAATAFLVVLLAPWLSRGILGDAGLAGALSLGAAVMFFAALNGSQVGALSGLEAFNWVALGNLVRGCSIIVFVTAGAAWDGVAGALLGYIAVGMATAIFYQFAIRRKCASAAIAISYRFTRKDLRMLSQFTLPVLVTALSFTPAAWWSNVLLANHSGYAEAGVFGAIVHWQMFILFFTNAIGNIGLPMLSNLRAERNSARYRKCLAINFVLTTAPAIGIAVVVAAFSRPIMGMYGPAFEHGAAGLVLISFASVLTAINTPVGHVLWSLDATTSAVLLALLRGGVLVLAAYALADKGATGLAGAYVIMGVVQTAATVPFMVWLLRRKLTPVTAREEAAVA